ncbi:MAG: RnfABCDGE type electron transport complex subunit D, partial [Eubacterium sp.]|nr:RnfABCDGE type electron transport complex subunit D [Eubacterium sp.]
MKLTVASSPHIRGNFRTNRIMMDVVIALLPSLAVGIWKFGIQALVVTAVSILSAVATEYLYSLAMKKRNTVVDCSAVVTGLLLAMTLPATVPVWQVVIGNVFAILFVKVLCGGLGQNIFNPALAGRALMMILWPASLTRFFEGGVDAVSSSTPLHHMVMPAIPEVSLVDMFLGNVTGC